MKLEMAKPELLSLVIRQISNLFSFRPEDDVRMLTLSVGIALERCEYCFSHISNKYYSREGQVYFNPFHSGQYAIFLYFLGNTVANSGKEHRTLADRIYYLNKCLNGLDLFYEVKMPKVFFLDHPVGSVIGRAVYGERFSFSQNCTVGNNKGKYPTMGENVRMMSGSKVVGNCKIGDNVIVAANTYIKDINIPSCSLVFGSSPDLLIKNKPESYFANAICSPSPLKARTSDRPS